MASLPQASWGEALKAVVLVSASKQVREATLLSVPPAG
jgi:hypothetical protein